MISGLPTGEEALVLFDPESLTDANGTIAPLSWSFDSTLGVFTVQLDGADGEVTGVLGVALIQDSDVDLLLTITATAIDQGSGLSLTSEPLATVLPLEAIADGGANIVSDGIEVSENGAPVDLNLIFEPRGGNEDNPDGDAFNGGGFDEDGSEAVTGCGDPER